jgi:hypothetical protein
VTGVEATSAFAGDPQPVEVFHRGVWYSGELLGWRHDDEGRCVARVRCRVNGLRHSAWVDLAALRLPGATPDDDAAPVAVAAQSRPPVPPPPPVERPVERPVVAARPAVPRRDAVAVRPAAPAPAALDETQPHVLLPVRRQRPRPVGLTLPPPRYPRPSEQSGSRWASAV